MKSPERSARKIGLKTQALFSLGLVLVWGCIGLLSGCSSQADPMAQHPDKPGLMVQDGITLPAFATAMDQLNYTATRFAHKKEKSAALRAVLTRFPNDHLECGQAAIGLAYLHLEPDYRFATAAQIRQAEKDFLDILDAFSQFSDIQAKAHWYLGWIYTRLLDSPQKAMDHFWIIAREYDGLPIHLSAGMPWTTLTHDSPSAPVSLTGTDNQYWSELALLEIVRHAPDTPMALAAFDRLYAHHFNGRAMGFALMAMLKDPDLAPKALDKFEYYLARNRGNPYLAKDIRTLAQAYAR